MNTDSIPEIWQTLETELQRLLPGHNPKFRRGLDLAAISAAERSLNLSFPEDYRQSLLVHDGQDVDPELWWLPHAIGLAPLESVVQCWLQDRKAYDPAPERFEWLDKSNKTRQCHFHAGQIPVAGSTYWDYDRLLLDFVPGPKGAMGQVISRCDVELVFLCDSFADLLIGTTIGLVRGMAVFVDGLPELGGIPTIEYRSPRSKKSISAEKFFSTTRR